MAKKSQKKSFSALMRSSAGGFIVISAIFIAILLFYPGSNVFEYLAARREISAQRKKMNSMKREIVAMENAIQDLTSDKDTLEQFAREKFHFCEEGEDVYLLK